VDALLFAQGKQCLQRPLSPLPAGVRAAHLLCGRTRPESLPGAQPDSDLAPKQVTAEDEFETLSQRLLSASLKLARPPNMCVAVESTPEGVTAAHNCSMKAIGVQVRGAARAWRHTAATGQLHI
jgi:hypothetical protein